jgi:hypothetical protein
MWIIRQSLWRIRLLHLHKVMHILFKISNFFAWIFFDTGAAMVKLSKNILIRGEFYYDFK